MHHFKVLKLRIHWKPWSKMILKVLASSRCRLLPSLNRLMLNLRNQLKNQLSRNLSQALRNHPMKSHHLINLHPMRNQHLTKSPLVWTSNQYLNTLANWWSNNRILITKTSSQLVCNHLYDYHWRTPCLKSRLPCQIWVNKIQSFLIIHLSYLISQLNKHLLCQ